MAAVARNYNGFYIESRDYSLTIGKSYRHMSLGLLKFVRMYPDPASIYHLGVFEDDNGKEHIFDSRILKDVFYKE